MPRFAILRHDTPQGRHFDFLIEQEGVLKTWSLPKPPQLGFEIEAQPLADHRLAYLDYEGPISGDRGSVTRWDAGTYSTKNRTETIWEIDIRGNRFSGQVMIDESKGRTKFSFKAPLKKEEEGKKRK
jgi:hypothetical protein